MVGGDELHSLLHSPNFDHPYRGHMDRPISCIYRPVALAVSILRFIYQLTITAVHKFIRIETG